MRFLCLPGAYGSAKNFGVQLGPFAKHMEDRGLATFAFTQGQHEVDPPTGWENYFGSRPLYRFFDVAEGDMFEAVRRVRHIPRGLSPEATMRLFQPDQPDQQPVRCDWSTFENALDHLMKVVDEDPDIDGLIGYSEGAMMAACIAAEENRRWEETGAPRRIKFAIFFAGTPPLIREGGGFVAKLADRHDTVINIPTFHVFGSNDPLVYASIALYNSCDQNTAHLYDHGLGHLVPRDADNVEQLGDTLSDVITRINAEHDEAAAATAAAAHDGDDDNASKEKWEEDVGDDTAAAAATTTAVGGVKTKPMTVAAAGEVALIPEFDVPSSFSAESTTTASRSSAASSAWSTAESDLDSRSSSHGPASVVDGIAKIQLK
ncbi:serine hydrolase-domain-containing protein [Hypoxylon sp. FL1150]|nr:serine hydrolase-domain-containing protein [Hypoxylon sp. FL1150]